MQLQSSDEATCRLVAYMVTTELDADADWRRRDRLPSRMGRVRWCVSCQPPRLMMDGPAHAARTGHITQLLTSDERQHLETNGRDGLTPQPQQTFADVAVAVSNSRSEPASKCARNGYSGRVADVAVAVPNSRSEPASTCAPNDYTFEFGEHFGKTVAEVCASPEGRAYMDDFIRTVNFNLDDRPALKEALLAAGVPVPESSCKQNRGTRVHPFARRDRNTRSAARAVASERYTPQRQRSPPRATHRSRAANSQTSIDCVRSCTGELTNFMQEAGVFPALMGSKCIATGCDGVLGELEVTKDTHSIFQRNVYHRCGSCERKWLPCNGYPLFKTLGRGSLSISLRLFAFRRCAEGISIGVAERLLGTSARALQTF